MSAPPRVVVATRSRHKLLEIRDVLLELRVRFVDLNELRIVQRDEEDDLEEFDTFAENAAAKARYFADLTGLPTIADDSGLCVDALDGGPGVRTKRFAPEDLVKDFGRDEANNRYLLEQLTGVPNEARGARYRCAIAAVVDGEVSVFEGSVEGRIAREPSGRGGFGYDPLFILGSHGRTYASLSREIKRATSHRALALQQLVPWLEALFSKG